MILLDMISIINSEAFMLQFSFSPFFGYERLFVYLEALSQSTISNVEVFSSFYYRSGQY